MAALEEDSGNEAEEFENEAQLGLELIDKQDKDNFLKVIKWICEAKDLSSSTQPCCNWNRI